MMRAPCDASLPLRGNDRHHRPVAFLVECGHRVDPDLFMGVSVSCAIGARGAARSVSRAYAPSPRASILRCVSASTIARIAPNSGAESV